MDPAGDMREKPFTELLATADGGSAPAIHTAPRYGSAPCQWDGFVLERHVLPAGALETTIMPVHCLAIPIGGAPVPIGWRVNGRQLSGAMAPNRVYFRAAGDSLSSAWSAPLDAIFLSLHHDAVDRACQEARDRTAPDLGSDFSGEVGSALAELVVALDTHMRGGCAAGSLYEQTLLLAIGASVAEHFGGNRALSLPRRRQAVGKLPVHILSRLDAFIRANLAEAMTIEMLAAVAHMSTFHLCRMFRNTRQVSLWQYVLMFRIEHARGLMLRHLDMPLESVAVASGFDSYTQFFAAFRKFCRTSPSTFRRNASGPISMRKPAF